MTGSRDERDLRLQLLAQPASATRMAALAAAGEADKLGPLDRAMSTRWEQRDIGGDGAHECLEVGGTANGEVGLVGHGDVAAQQLLYAFGLERAGHLSPHPVLSMDGCIHAYVHSCW